MPRRVVAITHVTRPTLLVVVIDRRETARHSVLGWTELELPLSSSPQATTRPGHLSSNPDESSTRQLAALVTGDRIVVTTAGADGA